MRKLARVGRPGFALAALHLSGEFAESRGASTGHELRCRLRDRVILTAEDVQRDVGFVAHNPAVVTGRNVEEVPRAHHNLGTLVHLRHRLAAQHESDVLNLARALARRRTNMFRPFPSRLVGRAADSRRPHAVELESALLEGPHLGRIVEVDQLQVHRVIIDERAQRPVRAGEEGKARDVLEEVTEHQAVRDESPERKIEEIQEVEEEDGGLRLLKQRWVRPALIVAIGLAAFQQFIGINTIIYYAPTTLTSVVFAADSAIYLNLIIGTLNVLLTIVAIRIIDRVGRKPMLLFGLVGMVTSLTVLGLSSELLATPTSSSDPAAIITFICLAGFIVSFAATWGPVVGVILPEVLPLSVRGTAMGVAVYEIDRTRYPPRLRRGRDRRGRRGPLGGADRDDAGGARARCREPRGGRPGGDGSLGQRVGGGADHPPHVAKVLCVSPADTGIRAAGAKTDRLDARTLAKPLAAGQLESVWVPDEKIRAMRRRLARGSWT
jgi:hypothetical protein